MQSGALQEQDGRFLANCDELEQINRRIDSLITKIGRLPANSLAGLRAKAMVAINVNSPELFCVPADDLDYELGGSRALIEAVAHLVGLDDVIAGVPQVLGFMYERGEPDSGPAVAALQSDDPDTRADAELYHLKRDWEVARTEFRVGIAGNHPDEPVLAAAKRMVAAEQQLLRRPAHSLAGLHTKLDVAKTTFGDMREIEHMRCGAANWADVAERMADLISYLRDDVAGMVDARA